MSLGRHENAEGSSHAPQSSTADSIPANNEDTSAESGRTILKMPYSEPPFESPELHARQTEHCQTGSTSARRSRRPNSLWDPATLQEHATYFKHWRALTCLDKGSRCVKCGRKYTDRSVEEGEEIVSHTMLEFATVHRRCFLKFKGDEDNTRTAMTSLAALNDVSDLENTTETQSADC